MSRLDTLIPCIETFQDTLSVSPAWSLAPPWCPSPPRCPQGNPRHPAEDQWRNEPGEGRLSYLLLAVFLFILWPLFLEKSPEAARAENEGGQEEDGDEEDDLPPAQARPLPYEGLEAATLWQEIFHSKLSNGGLGWLTWEEVRGSCIWIILRECIYVPSVRSSPADLLRRKYELTTSFILW